jgi:hypothetical protein
VLGATDVVVWCLAHVREVLAEHRVLDVRAGEIAEPGNGRELELQVRVEVPQDFDVALIELVRRDRPMPSERCVAVARPAGGFFHA